MSAGVQYFQRIVHFFAFFSVKESVEITVFRNELTDLGAGGFAFQEAESENRFRIVLVFRIENAAELVQKAVFSHHVLQCALGGIEAKVRPS